jgi:hypothetical protein
MNDPVRNMLVEVFGPAAAAALLLSDDELAQADADNALAIAQAGREEQLAEDG